MFKKKSPGLSFIAQGSSVEGKFKFDGDCLIGGELDGELLSKSNVVIEKCGKYQGNLACVEIQVAGSFKGSLSCQRLIVHNDGIVEGEVYCEYMEIYDQGQFVGVRVKETPKWLSDSSIDQFDSFDKKQNSSRNTGSDNVFINNS